MRRVPDLTALAAGHLRLLDPSEHDYPRLAVRLMFDGISIADEKTWNEWRSFRAVEVWQAAALQLHLDLETVAWDKLGCRRLSGRRAVERCPSVAPASRRHRPHSHSDLEAFVGRRSGHRFGTGNGGAFAAGDDVAVREGGHGASSIGTESAPASGSWVYGAPGCPTDTPFSVRWRAVTSRFLQGVYIDVLCPAVRFSHPVIRRAPSRLMRV